MADTKGFLVELPQDLLDVMREFKRTDGVPLGRQLELAIKAWLTERGVWPPAQLKEGKRTSKPRVK